MPMDLQFGVFRKNFTDQIQHALEEGGAVSYTRENYIVVRGLVNEASLIHELFHILTRFKPEKRNALFKTILIFTESNRIEYPEGIRDFIITNPDAPFP